MKYTIILILMLAMTVFAGCEKKLEVTPSYQSTEDMALSTLDGMDAALSGAYAFFYGPVGTSFTLWADAMSDHFVYTGAVQNVKNFYERNLTAVADETPNGTTFVATGNLSNYYRVVNIASLVIRGIDRGYANADVAFDRNKNRLLGECYFLRGAMYFNLVRFYAKQWGATPGNTHPGIVLNKEAVEDRESQIKKRATVAEVYEFIIEDLKRAQELLPDQYDPAVHPAIYHGRTYKDGATGFLARVYFQQREYAKAKAEIDRVLGSIPGAPSKHQLESDMTALFTLRGAENTSTENIVQYTTPSGINASNGIGFFGANQGVYAVPTARVSTNFLADAHFYSDDPRYVRFLRSHATGQIPNKYSLALYANLPIIRSAEMLLDRAEINALNFEANNNVNDKNAAIADCNAIRNRAYGTSAASRELPLTITISDLKDSIRVERIRELAFEGDRLWNLKRLMVPIPAGERAGAVPLPWDGNELVFKFNSQDISKNPLLENNY